MSIASEVSRLQGAKEALAGAIAAKGVAVPEGTALDGYAALVAQIPQGGGSGGPVAPKEVNFWDYDGTCVAAYTAEEAAALTALPDGPSHEGLVFDGWNWTLAQVQAASRAEVGAMYATGDGATRLVLRLTAARREVPLCIGQTVANGVSIDWGDGSPAETLPGAGSVNTTHTYAAAGDYTISLLPAEGCTLGLGSGDYAGNLFGLPIGAGGGAAAAPLKRVHIGRGVEAIGPIGFSEFPCLSSVSLPSGITQIDMNAFQSCNSLRYLTIPPAAGVLMNGLFSSDASLFCLSFPRDGIFFFNDLFNGCSALSRVLLPEDMYETGSVPGAMFNGCTALERMDIPPAAEISSAMFMGCTALSEIRLADGTPSIGEYAFSGCVSLSEVTVPTSVLFIGDQAFEGCTGILAYHFLSPSPPTLGGSGVFTSIPDDCVITVPAGSGQAYKTATNWTVVADHIQEEGVGS